MEKCGEGKSAIEPLNGDGTRVREPSCDFFETLTPVCPRCSARGRAIRSAAPGWRLQAMGESKLRSNSTTQPDLRVTIVERKMRT